MKEKHLYCVSRICTYNKDVYATSEEEAIEIAKNDEEEWESNPNDEFLDIYEYFADIED